ncbi:prepilin-type N-terminal cleavage/methylation domain-containing protein [Myxococcus stipitatus]|uniref:type IV pilus modification PilV family protein n=1 Tax=Myxococcus stipitatus TaxID=83455 RepID=UPI001F2FF28A|nr:prepilin-type N-terminal cleavage/methylation domain-containing protein [Myxococcus stipitatus]MCE9666694.1 prepilin-type N-terminal cleavage/methylation domain-containing protein [Myxococcus stipitatus]
MRRNGGFTLLEVVVALAILGLALMAIFDLNAGAVNNHVYTKRLTVASLLARSKMTDVEQKLFDDGFNADDDEESGDFSDEGWPNFKWKARIIAPKLDGVTPDQLIGAIFNLPMGGDSSDPMSGIASLFGGGGDSGGKDGASGGPTPAGGGLGGAAMGMAQPMFAQMVQQLTQTVREVHLTVYWQEGAVVESVDLVTHVVSLGPGSDRNGGSALNAGGGETPGANNQWVDPDTGQLVPNPIPGPNGQFLHPQSRKPLMNRQEWLNRMNGGQRPGGQNGLIPGGIQGGVRPQLPGLPGFPRRDR